MKSKHQYYPKLWHKYTTIFYIDICKPRVNLDSHSNSSVNRYLQPIWGTQRSIPPFYIPSISSPTPTLVGNQLQCLFIFPIYFRDNKQIYALKNFCIIAYIELKKIFLSQICHMKEIFKNFFKFKKCMGMFIIFHSCIVLFFV